MSFGLMTRVGPRYHVLDGGPVTLRRRSNFVLGEVAANCKVMGHSMVCCAKMAEPIDMPFWMKTQVRPQNHVLGRVQIPQGEVAILGVVRAIRKHWQSSLQRRCKRDYSVCQANANSILKIYGRRRCSLLTAKGLVGLHSAVEV